MLQKTARGNKRIAVISGLLASVLLTVTVYAASERTPSVSGGDRTLFSNITVAQKVVDLLENGISVRKTDNSFTGIESFALGRTKRVVIDDGSNVKEIYTSKTYVGQLIEDGSIKYTSDFDFIDAAPDAVITNNLKIGVTHVTSESYKTEFDIPYNTVTEYDNTLRIGETVVVQEGENGKKEENVEIVYHNGVEFDKKVSQTVVKEAKDKIVKIGTLEYEPVQSQIVEPVASAAVEESAKPAPVKFKASAYCACRTCCGKSNGITASGTKAAYGTVAVDPKVIPLGTKLYIEASDGSFIYGECVAADTGGAIKGNRVDLFFPSHSEALNFGRRTVDVYILG